MKDEPSIQEYRAAADQAAAALVAATLKARGSLEAFADGILLAAEMVGAVGGKKMSPQAAALMPLRLAVEAAITAHRQVLADLLTLLQASSALTDRKLGEVTDPVAARQQPLPLAGT